VDILSHFPLTWDQLQILERNLRLASETLLSGKNFIACCAIRIGKVNRSGANLGKSIAVELRTPTIENLVGVHESVFDTAKVGA